MGIFTNENTPEDESYKQVLDMVKDLSPEDFDRWKKALTKAYKAHQEFKELEDAPADDIEKAEQELEFIEEAHE